MENLPPESPPPRSPSSECASCPVVEEAPASPKVPCSQPEYRIEVYERQNGPLPGHEKVDGWLRDVQAAYESDGPSSYPTPRKDQYVSDSDSEHGRPRRRRRRSPPATRIKNAVLYVHKDYDGRLPLCYYATGLQEGGLHESHDGHACFNMRDILWARRVRFHIERMLNL